MAGAFKGIAGVVGEIVKEFFVSTVAISLHEKASATGEKPNAAQAAGKAVASFVAKSFEESRVELLAFVKKMRAEDKFAAQQFLDRQRMRQFLELKPYETEDKPGNHYQPGDENKFNKLMTKLFVGLSDSDESEERKETFKWLLRMDHREFDSTIEMLNHDVIKQMYEKAKLMVGDVGNELTDLFVKEDDRLKKMTKKLGYKV